MLKIRLSPVGVRHHPKYNVVVSQSRKRLRSMPVEVIGHYNPIPTVQQPVTTSILDPPFPASPAGFTVAKELQLAKARCQYWLGVGAQPTPAVVRLFKVSELPLPSHIEKYFESNPWGRTKTAKAVRRKKQADAAAKAE